MHVVAAVVILFAGLLTYFYVIPAIGAAALILWMVLPCIIGALIIGLTAIPLLVRGHDDLAAAIALGGLVAIASAQTRWNCYIEKRPPRWWWD